MTFKTFLAPLKKTVVVGAAFGAIFTLTSTYLDADRQETEQKVRQEQTSTNVARLINTQWKLKYYDCSNCTSRADDLNLQEGGQGTLEGLPISWTVKEDTISITTNPKHQCNFPSVLLADENLMFGTSVCLGDSKAASFIANKIALPRSVASSASVAANNSSESVVLNRSVAYFDKTHMFKRGFERVYGDRKVDVLIIHSSFCINSNNPFDLYCVLAEYKRHGVAAHYLIDRDGGIHRLVNENNIAFHAGFGKLPDGYNAINTRSMGIELINSESEGPTAAQYESLSKLVKDVKTRHRIKYIKGHNQICPGRKSDPWRFNWKTFYESLKDDEFGQP